MQNESHPVPGADPVIAEPAPPPPLPEAAPSKKLLAPVWHTVLIVLLVVGNSFVTAFFTSHKTQDLHSVTEIHRHNRAGIFPSRCSMGRTAPQEDDDS
jgi:hypothetical protein